MMLVRHGWMVAGLSLVLMGCGASRPGSPQSRDEEPAPDPAALAAAAHLVLPTEPADPRSVIEVRKDAQDGDEVAVVGRVGGSEHPFVVGRTSFLIVDASLKPAMQCDCPWDYCEMPSKELTSARISVKFTDAEGNTLRVGPRHLFGIKELSTVVVKGRVSRDDRGNVTILGSGLFVRKDPT